MYAKNETIVALATAPGQGAIAIIRLSGSDAITIADKIFKGKKLADQKSHTIHFGRILSPSLGGGEVGEVVDEVVISLYRAPNSYTGEEVVEISCHGSQYIIQKIISLCTENGATLAKPGEFTQRAFMNGKMDLAQAEAVAELIAGETESAHHAAMYNLRGGFSAELHQLREQLINFTALIELELDFSQEDVEFADRTQLYALIENSKFKIQKLLGSFQLGNVIKNGVKVAIIGKPNAGKSTLLNALLNEERAIVSEIAGTTRDTIEEVLNINGILFRIIDTAGIREHTADTIESIGIERSKKAMEAAEIILHLTEPGEELAIENTNIPVLQIINKADLLSNEKFTRLQSENPQAIFISAKKGEGIDELKERLYEMAVGNKSISEGALVTNARHHAALQQVLQSLLDVKTGMDNQLSGDLIALDIRRCLFFLGTITGEVQVDRDILGAIFGKFCIGK